MEQKTLKQYKAIALEIQELKAEIKEWESCLRLQGDTLYCQRPEDAFSEKASFLADELKVLLIEKIDALIALRREIEMAFIPLTSTERRLLRKKYFYGKTNQMIANEMFMSVDNVKRIHSTIMKKL